MSSVQATEFPRFLELPFEIRWTIYELCLPTRVIDNEIFDVESFPTHLIIPEERLAFKQTVDKFSRTPVIARASPEVYRDLQRYVVAPPDGGWVWSWHDNGTKFFTDKRPVIFDPRSDIVHVFPDNWQMCQDSDERLNVGPYCLARSLDATVAINKYALEYFGSCKSLLNYCFSGRKKCTLILSQTWITEPAEWIASCGLFGLFGEERTVLVDVDDFERIDYFDKTLNGHVHGIYQSMHDFAHKSDAHFSIGGLRRYSSHGTVDPTTAWCENSPVVSAEERAKIIARDKKKMMCWVRQTWLEVNGYFEGTELDDLFFVPPDDEFWERVVDEELYPNTKPWYDKLPVFSFAVRVDAQDLEEEARVRDAKNARYATKH